ncbi:MAG: hypothetical protein J5I47_13505 [Vicingus serpentipes]|nr:hypothetical protein [Vicingus serpentipes]
MSKNLFIFVLLGFIIMSLTRCEDTVTLKKEQLNQDTLALTNSWEMAIPHQAIPEGLTSLSAESCKACHQEHYNEWKLSTHAHAWTDKQFQSELKKESSPYLCINCHIPLQNQQEYVVTGLIDGDVYQPVKKKNPHYDEKLREEGINCASCHIRDGYVIGPTGTKLAPHKTKKDTIHLSEQLCISCHNATAVVTPTLACTFETGDEWKSGPYYGQKNCISCHMPELNRSIVAGYDKRKSRKHSFIGSGIPKDTTYIPERLDGYGFYPSPVKQNYKVNDSLIFNFRVKNEYAGHRVPTGDPERFFIFNFQLMDEEGKVMAKKKERVGEEWQWYPEAKKLSDNNLNPLEERVFYFNNLLKRKGNYSLLIEVTKHRMNEETATYNKLGKDYPLFISVYKEEFRFVVR